MHTLCIGITRECNWNKCTYCHVQKDPIPNKWEFIQPVLDFVVENMSSIRTVKFFGGEPLLAWKEIQQVMEYVKGKDASMNFEINTNGLLLSQEMLEALLPCAPRFLLSVDGGLSTLKASRHYGTEEIDTLKRSISLLEHNGQLATTQVNIAIAPSTAKEFVHNVISLYGRGFRRFNILPAFYVPWSEQQLAILEQQFDLLGTLLGRLPGIHFINADASAPMPLFCDHLVLDVDGELYASMIIFERFFTPLKERMHVGSWNKLSEVAQALSHVDTSCLSELPLPARVLDNTQTVDRMLSRFVRNYLLTTPHVL